MATPQTLTTKQLQAGFKVGHMTIFNWRAGSAKRGKLPCTTTDGRVTFKLSEVKAWARKHGLEFTEPTAEAEVTKPGPKPKAAAPAKKAGSKLATIAEIHTAGTQTGRVSGKTPAKSNPPKAAAKKVAAEKPGKLARAIGAHAKATENKKAKPAAQPAA